MDGAGDTGSCGTGIIYSREKRQDSARKLRQYLTSAKGSAGSKFAASSPPSPEIGLRAVPVILGYLAGELQGKSLGEYLVAHQSRTAIPFARRIHAIECHHQSAAGSLAVMPGGLVGLWFLAGRFELHPQNIAVFSP